jgi:ATP-dependent Lhr-like helicase
LDAVHPPEAPLDILAQQLIAETAAAEWRTHDLYELVTAAHPYRDLSREVFDEVLQLVSHGIVTGRGTRAAYVHHDTVNDELRGRKGARLAALTSGGAIPEIGDFRVVLEPEGTLLGTVNEDWATESMAGDIFLLGTHAWQILRVTSGEVRVVDAEGKPPTVPFWTGEAPARTAELSHEVSKLRQMVDTFLCDDDPAGATRWIVDTAGVDREAAALVVSYLSAGRAMLGVMPTQSDLVLERFFDEAGGMQLVIHSPYGGRINRAMGYALRKKFCRTFNFELQASASDDAVVISLGPHHSFPLHDVPRFLTPHTILDTLRQAVLDQPVFLIRWRWNLNRSLAVLRWRGGRRNPPPIQRMESDDFMAALFPGAAACQENITGPIEIPDHPIVRQTLHDALSESLDAEGLVELWRDVAAGRVAFHARDTTEPSVFSHEILTAKPYAFLDDGEAVDRRTNAVPLRRGLPLHPEQLGTLLPEAVERVRDEITPHPTTADEVHDLLSALVVTRARDHWRTLFVELCERGRVTSVVRADVEWWHTVERSAQAAVLLGTEPCDSDTSACRDPALIGPGADEGAPQVPSPEEVATEVVRGHLDLHSPCTAAELAHLCSLSDTLVAVALATLESQGFALRGSFAPDRPGEAETRWCSRRLLARMHAYSRQSRRRRSQPVSAVDFCRFLTRWQHAAPGSQVSGIAGLRRVLERLQGFEAAAAAWEPHLLGVRVTDYRTGWLDRLCQAGEVGWLRLRIRELDDPDRRTGTTSKATPISVVFRHDLAWLLPAHRGQTEPEIPSCGAVADVMEALSADGALFASELVAKTGRLSSDIEAALWEAVARGLVSGDGFAAIRDLVTRHRKAGPPGNRLSRLRLGAHAPLPSAGRWSVIPASAPSPSADPDELTDALADQLLQRWGVVFYDLVASERLATPWRHLQWALRRLEDRGVVRGGRFVTGFSGEQFALPEAVDGLDSLRRRPGSGGSMVVNACDPLNLTGIILPGSRVAGVRTKQVEIPCA